MNTSVTDTDVVTDEQAQAVLEVIVLRYREYFEPLTNEAGKVLAPPYPQPTILRDERGHAVISWEEGPSDWAMQVTTGGSTEEDRVLHANAGREFGVELTAPEPEPVQFPPGVHVEPNTSYSLGIYPD